MQVIATAGHVDHGKSALVRALTGMEPDRLAEERRRGLTIELGFVWTDLPSGQQLAFVDVPGHERFLTTMLAGVGPVPAALFVVAADEGWSAQSTEHLAALDALNVRCGLLVVTKRDLADHAPTLVQARAQLAGTSLADAEAVAVSARTGEGLDALTTALDRLACSLPTPDPDAPVRLWADRVFTIAGAGTVVTGTLTQGTVRVGDEMLVAGRRGVVRGLQTLGQRRDSVSGVARVAVNLRGVDRAAVRRGDALLTPGQWLHTTVVDVSATRELRAGETTMHCGAASVRARVRPLGEHVARLTLERELPLRIGDRALLRDPGGGTITGLRVLDVRPPLLRRRGAARARAAELGTEVPDTPTLLRWHGLLRQDQLAAMGARADYQPVAANWLADPEHWRRLRERLTELVANHGTEHPLEPALPVDAACRDLGLPDRALVEALVRPPLALRNGRIVRPAELPREVEDAVIRLRKRLADAPFDAPDAGWLAAHGIGPKVISAAARHNTVLHLGSGVVLLPDAPERAKERLAELPQPFTASDARRALASTRRVVIPLLEHLDTLGLTRRVDDAHRIVR